MIAATNRLRDGWYRSNTILLVVVFLALSLAVIGIGAAAASSTGDVADAPMQVEDEDDEAVTFVATSQGGFVAFSETTEDEARGGGVAFPVEGEDQPIQIAAEVDEDNTWESTDIEFPELHVQGDLYADVDAPEGLSGEIDPEANRMTAEGQLDVTIAGESFSFQIAATSGDSNELTGSANLDTDPATVTLVDNEFLVTDQTGGTIDRALDLPSETEGENWFELELDVDLEGDELQEFESETGNDESDEQTNVDLALTVTGQAFGIVGLAGAVIFMAITIVARYTGLVSLE